MLARPLSAAHWATNSEDVRRCQLVVKLPPFAPATATWCSQGPPASLRRATTIGSPPCAPASTPSIVTLPPARRRALRASRVLLLEILSADSLPASPPEVVKKSR